MSSGLLERLSMATAELTTPTATTKTKRGRKARKSYLDHLSETTGSKVQSLGSVPSVPDEYNPAVFAPLKENEFEDALHYWDFQKAYHTHFVTAATAKGDELRTMDPSVRNDFANVMKSTDVVIAHIEALVAKGHNISGVFAKLQSKFTTT